MIQSQSDPLSRVACRYRLYDPNGYMEGGERRRFHFISKSLFVLYHFRFNLNMEFTATKGGGLKSVSQLLYTSACRHSYSDQIRRQGPRKSSQGLYFAAL